MNLLQNLKDSLSRPQRQISQENDMLRQQLQAALERAKLAESMFRQLQEQLPQSGQTDNVLNDAVVARFREQDGKDDVQAATRKGPGRPRIKSRRVNLNLDQDLAVILEHLSQTQDIPLTRLMNNVLREWISTHHAPLVVALSIIKDNDGTNKAFSPSSDCLEMPVGGNL